MGEGRLLVTFYHQQPEVGLNECCNVGKGSQGYTAGNQR
jgi:hypothetical protein